MFAMTVRHIRSDHRTLLRQTHRRLDGGGPAGHRRAARRRQKVAMGTPVALIQPARRARSRKSLRCQHLATKKPRVATRGTGGPRGAGRIRTADNGLAIHCFSPEIPGKTPVSQSEGAPRGQLKRKMYARKPFSSGSSSGSNAARSAWTTRPNRPSSK